MAVYLWAVLGAIGPSLAATYVWFKWLHELREKRRERAEKEKAQKANAEAQAELALIRRRSHAPFLVLGGSRSQRLMWLQGTQLVWINFDNPGFLHGYRHEVKAEHRADTTAIFLVVENRGEAAKHCVIKLEEEEISLEQEADISDSDGTQFLLYAYSPALHGVEQKITITFESNSGIQDKHVYLTRHGCRVLKRIDPPLPE